MARDIKHGQYEATINGKKVSVITYFLSERQGNAEVIEHDSVMRLGRALGVTFDMDHSGVEAYVVGSTLSVIARAQAKGLDTTTNEVIEVVEYHEAHSNKLDGIVPQDRFPVRMAWKRAQDKAILEIARPMLQAVGLPEHLYSDLEFDVDVGASSVDTSWLQGGQQFPNIQIPNPPVQVDQPVINPFPQPTTTVPQPIMPGTITTVTTGNNNYPMQTNENNYQLPPGQFVLPPEVTNNMPHTPDDFVPQAPPQPFNPFQNSQPQVAPNIPVQPIPEQQVSEVDQSQFLQQLEGEGVPLADQASTDQPALPQEAITESQNVPAEGQLICVDCGKPIVSEGEANFGNNLIAEFINEGKADRAHRCYDCGVSKYAELSKGAFEPSE